MDGATAADVNAQRLQYLRDNAKAVAAWPAWMREGARTPERGGAFAWSDSEGTCEYPADEQGDGAL